MKYEQMTHDITTTKEETERMEQAEMSDFKSQIGMGMNMMVAAFTAMLFGYFVGTKWLGTLGGVIVGLFVGIVVLVAEVGVFIIKLDRVDAAQANPNFKVRFLPASVRTRKAPPTPIPPELLLPMKNRIWHQHGDTLLGNTDTPTTPAEQTATSSKQQDTLKRRKEPHRKQK